MELQHGHRESAQLRELCDILSCAKYEQQAVSQKDTEHQSHLGKGQEGDDESLGNPECERRPEDLSGQCVAEAHESIDL